MPPVDIISQVNSMEIEVPFSNSPLILDAQLRPERGQHCVEEAGGFRGGGYG